MNYENKMMTTQTQIHVIDRRLAESLLAQFQVRFGYGHKAQIKDAGKHVSVFIDSEKPIKDVMADWLELRR